MNKLSLIAFVAAITTAPAFAANHLEPDDAFFASYHQKVKAAFKELYEPSVLVRMTVEPSFSVEYAVALKRVGKAYAIVSVTAEDQLWKFEVLKQMKAGDISSSDDKGNDTTAEEIRKLEASLPKDPNEVKVERCEITIDAPLAERIIAVWQRMLRGTHPAPYDGGLDGEFYHFSGTVERKDLAGQVWSPADYSDPGYLVRIGEGLREYCKKRTPPILEGVGRDADHLNRTLSP